VVPYKDGQSGEENAMSLSSHLQELRKKHLHLSQSVEDAQRSPGVNALKITEMKRNKLRLKEQIARLSKD
jgi:hypothetical protein